MASIMASIIAAVVLMIMAVAGLSQAKNIPVDWKYPLANTSINAACNDKLVFNFVSNNYSVVQITNNSCAGTDVKSYGKTSPTTITLSATGTTYYTSRVSAKQCTKQILTVKTTCPSVTHLLTTASGHPEWSDEYGTYNTINAKCGDKLRFKWAGDEHDIVQFPTYAAYKACDFIGSKLWSIHHEDWDTTVTLTKAGITYYGCTVHDHCEVGMKVRVVTTC